MVYTYSECKEKYKTDYELRKALAAGELKKVHHGIYTDDLYESDLSIISAAYPYAVFTLNSAFYYHGLTDTIPDAYYLITDKNATKIKDKDVIQYFDNNDSLLLGQETMQYDGASIRVFSKERMLIELVRNRKKLPFDYYKEIIFSYRKLVYNLDIQAIQEYAASLPKTNHIMETLQLEVF